MTQNTLANYPMEEREAYLALVASLASIDGVVSNEEVGALRQLCSQAGLGPRELGEVLAVAENPASAPLGEYVERLKRSELRFSVVRDLYALAQADQTVTEEEQREINDMARILGVEQQQREAIAGYTREQYRGIASVTGGAAAGAATAAVAPPAQRSAGYVPNPAQSAGASSSGGSNWTSALGGLGVPIAAVAAGGLLGGTGGAGLAGGAMALAQGKGAGGALKHAAVGAAGFSGARWLLKKLF